MNGGGRGTVWWSARLFYPLSLNEWVHHRKQANTSHVKTRINYVKKTQAAPVRVHANQFPKSSVSAGNTGPKQPLPLSLLPLLSPSLLSFPLCCVFTGGSLPRPLAFLHLLTALLLFVVFSAVLRLSQPLLLPHLSPLIAVMPPVAEANLAKLGIKLPPAAAPVATYAATNYSMGHLYISGQLPKDDAGNLVVGQCGKDVTEEQGAQAARLCGLNILAQIKSALGSLDRVKKVVKINCFVNSTSDFVKHPVVANGCSNLMVEVFGPEVGVHARCAVGMAQLPLGVAVEIDAQVEVEGHPSSL